ncbi:MAG: hypothetical protein COU69_03110 [Candidatus Pacebacteria bacterium CG10_big_fil_rev_8_21_14_0_10_56_10]|nr:MAG: hypothetical protein COU69_03110 [Candidatus Pacebacteria bacterium CG10_big_fil_rev_8_21_14_0_10_56_10]
MPTADTTTDTGCLSYTARQRRQAGFTLIEIVIYVLLVAVISTAVIMFASDIVINRVRGESQQAVNHSLNFVTKRLTHELRAARAIHFLTADQLCLDMTEADRDPTFIYQQNNQVGIGWGGGSSDCTGLQQDEVLSDPALTSVVSFQDLSTAGSQNVEFSLTVFSQSSSGRAEFEFSGDFTSSVELRTSQ